MRKTFKALLLIASLGVVQNPAAANLLTNGDFESPNLGSSGFQFDTTSIPGWTVTNTVDLTTSGCCFAAYSGKQDVDLVGSRGNGGLTQTFTTIVGQQYEITFAYAHTYGASVFPGGPTITSASASISVSGAASRLSDSVTDNTVYNGVSPTWHIYTGFFSADSTSTTLEILNTAGGYNGGIY